MSDIPTRPRVLALAFACDPERGSEAAAGWGTVNALAEFADVVALVSDVHMLNIEAWLRRQPNPSLRFVPVSFPASHLPRLRARLPLWLRRGERWLRYWEWQQAAKEVALRLHREQPFDVAIHASLGIHWQPSVVTDLPMPSVWGPVGGNTRSPRSLWPVIGPAGVAMEWLESFLARAVSLNPATRRTRTRADVRLIESEDTRDKLPGPLGSDAIVVHRSILSRIREVPQRQRQPYLVFSSPLERRKGPSLALAALAHTPPEVRLHFIHEGPEEPRLRRLAQSLGVADRVEFRGRVPRDEMWEAIAGAAACVFTGPNDVGGCALAEAMLAGAPVVVLGVGGSRALAESNTDPLRIAIIEPDTPGRTARLLGEAMARFAAELRPETGGYLDQESTKRQLRAALRLAIKRHAATRTRDQEIEAA